MVIYNISICTHTDAFLLHWVNNAYGRTNFAYFLVGKCSRLLHAIETLYQHLSLVGIQHETDSRASVYFHWGWWCERSRKFVI